MTPSKATATAPPARRRRPAVVLPRSLRPSTFPSVWSWLSAGPRRQPVATLVALLVGWTGVAYALGFAVMVGVAWTLVATFGRVSVLGAVLDTLEAAAAFVATALLSPVRAPLAVALGAVVAQLGVAVAVVAEPAVLALRNVRRLSDREQERVGPLLHEVAHEMGLASVPTLAVKPTVQPGAWALARTIVLSEGLGLHPDRRLLTDDELRAVLAHELQHWANGDPLATYFVLGCALPLAVPYFLGRWAKERLGTLAAVIGWFLFWPAWLLVHGVLMPALARGSRSREYEADRAAAAAGHGPAMRRVLERLEPFEPPRTAWDEVLANTHPPIELRLEALDRDVNGSGAGEPHPVAARVLVALLVAMAAVAVVPQPSRHHEPSVTAAHVPTAHGHDPAGAVAAASADDTRLAAVAVLTDAQIAATIRPLSAPDRRDALIAKSQRGAAAARSALAAGHITVTALRATQLGWRIASYSASSAVVQLWTAVTTDTNAGTVPAHETDTLTLRWQGHRWWLTDDAANTGPDAMPPGFTPFPAPQPSAGWR